MSCTLSLPALYIFVETNDSFHGAGATSKYEKKLAANKAYKSGGYSGDFSNAPLASHSNLFVVVLTSSIEQA